MARQKKGKFTEEVQEEHSLVPKNTTQREYIKALYSSPQTIVMGPAGTGKTYIATRVACELFQLGKIDKICLTRPNVSQSKSLGFFPGTLHEKIAPWVMPVSEVIIECLGKNTYELMLKRGQLDIIPFEVLRGRSLANAFILLDEAQNTTPAEMKTFLTRIGQNATCVVNGDISQSDLKATSGLATILHMNKRLGLGIPTIEFCVDEIVRSDLCKMWTKAFIEVEKSS